MPERQADLTRINVFEVDGRYVFKHYFEDYDLFSELQDYYNENHFEVPKNSFGGVRELLEEHRYDAVIVEDIKSHCVAKRRYTDHPDVLFKHSVLKRHTEDYNVFVMKDKENRDKAIREGALPLEELGIDVTF